MIQLETIRIINGDYYFDFEHIGSPVGFEYPKAKVTIEDLAGAKSAEYVASKFGSRSISWRSLLLEDRLDQVRTVQKCIRQGNLKTVKFCSCDLELQTEVEILSFSMPPKTGRRPMLIEAVAPDWRLYSQIERTHTLSKTIVYGGMSIPTNIPLSLSMGSYFNNNVVSYGDQDTNPTFTIQGPGTKFIIRNNTTDKEFVITRTITADQYVKVYVNTGSVLLNDITNIYSSVTGELWALSPDSNVITFYPVGAGESTLLTINWRDAYGGI